MAQIVYPYNPFNNNLNNTVTESFTLTAERNLYLPRAAPYFFNNLEVYSNAVINADGTITGTKLIAGTHFATGNPFNLFINKYNQNVFSSIVVPIPNDGNYVIRYNTIGGDFVLNEAAYAELVANQMSHDREAYWEDFIDVPTEWPPEPHTHPINLVYNVGDMMDLLQQLLLIKSKDPNNNTNLLTQHLNAALDAAHKADKSMVGLDNVDNYPSTKVSDIGTNNPNTFVTLGVLMEVLKRLANGTLNVN